MIHRYGRLSAVTVAAAALAAMSLLGGSPAFAATHGSSPRVVPSIANDNIESGTSGYCLDVNSSDYPADTNQIQLWPCNSNREQLWAFEGTQLVNNPPSSWCLDADSTDGGGFPSDGEAIQLWACNTNGEQTWKAVYVRSSGNGTREYNIENVAHPGYCLDANSTNYPSEGDPVQLWACDANNEQLWSFG
jgi:hypothetical protein